MKEVKFFEGQAKANTKTFTRKNVQINIEYCDSSERKAALISALFSAYK